MGEKQMRLQKRRIEKTLAIAAILLFAGALPAINAAMTVSPSGPQSATVDATEYWALCVGIGVYAENPEQDRPLMISEVDTFAQTLLDSGYPSDHVKVIQAENATISNILAGFRWLRTHEDSNDVSLVFLSTHGSPLLSPKGTPIDLPPKDETDGADEMLITYWGFAIPTAFLWDDEINVELNQLQSQGVCLIVDSCYAGGFNDHWTLDTPGSFTQSAQQWMTGFGEDVKGQNRVILMGCQEDEEASSGAFAPWLIDGLRGYADSNHDGIVTAEEAFNYTEPRTTWQHPTIYDGYPGELPLVTVPRHVPTTDNSQVALTKSTSASVAAGGMAHGFVKNATSSAPIPGATVDLYGRTADYESYENVTTTNLTGYYEITAPAGRYRITASADGYCDRESSTFSLNDGQVRWVNLSLYARPQENATICGFVTDNLTGVPLNGSNVSIYWQGSSGQSYSNQTLTDTTGFYSMSVATGAVDVTIEKQGYFDVSVWNVIIASFETRWVNVSLVSHPAETAVICGYLTDADSGLPFANARLTYEWVDFDSGRSYLKDTTSNSTGYYTITVAPGELYRDIRVMGYDSYDPYRHDGTANATIWQNVSLAPPTPSFGFLQPLNALYIHNKRVVPWSSPVVFGSVNVSVYFEDMWFGGGDVQKVEFYLDGKLQSTLTQQPYNWTWPARSLGKHIITVVAYNTEGNSASREISVRKLL